MKWKVYCPFSLDHLYKYLLTLFSSLFPACISFFVIYTNVTLNHVNTVSRIPLTIINKFIVLYLGLFATSVGSSRIFSIYLMCKIFLLSK